MNSKLTSLQSSITALQNKSYVELLNYSWGGFILRVWGVGHVRYFTIKGTMTQTLSSGVQINQRPSLIPVSGFTCFERGGFSIAVNTVNGQGAFVSDSTWKAGDYINIAGCYFATTRV